MTMLSKRVIAIDYGYLRSSFGFINDNQVITTFEPKKFNLTEDDFAQLAERYKTNHFVLTGPNTEFLPVKSSKYTFAKVGRIDALTQGVHFLSPQAPMLVILFEVGCHLFYHDKETLYLGCLPYSFSSFGLAKDISLKEEMGQELNSALAICATHALPHTRVMDRYETLLSYTIALGIKEFLARYQVNNHTIIGNITKNQKALLTSFLLPPIPNSEFRIPNFPSLPSPEHIAIFGMLSPYLA
ncbi:MAG: hypothetical protein HY817_01870 [Candidatus Abawacabacteria bacterium]|nr:hypothetical protein [Candidatus Abawacabacteria bacterium]